MSTTVSVAGSSYSVPQEGDSGWATDVTNLLIQLATSTKVLQVTSSSFPIAQDLSFGTNYGLKLQYLKSQAVNPASSGSVRLGNAESIKWRNQANSADLDLTVNSSNALQYNGATLLDTAGSGLTGLITDSMVSASAAIAYSKLNLSNSIVNADINSSAAIAYSKLNLTGTVVNADISNSASIAYSKLNLATSILNADISASAAIAYSKLALTNSIVNADISSSAAIAYSKLNLATSIVNADISASAAIARSKLATLTASRAMVTDGSGNDSVSAVTATELTKLSGLSGNITTDTNTQTLTNKTLTSPTLTTPTVDIETYTDQSSTPSSPAAGKRKLYSKTTGKFYQLDSSGVEREIGSGGTGVNFVTGGDAEGGSIFATYKDSSSAIPSDGTGGVPTISSASTTSTNPLSGANSFLLTHPASNVQGEGWSYDFSIDLANKAKVLKIEFDYILNSGTFVAGSSGVDSDIEVYIYDVTNATIIQPSSYKLLSNSSTTADHFSATFQTASNSTSYRLIFHCATTAASSFVLKLDSLSISPSQYVFGTPITDWTTWTPTGTWTTNSTYTGRWRRVGSNLEWRVRVTLAGAPNATSYGFNYPSGLVLDTSAIPFNGSDTVPLGSGVVRSAGSNYDASAYNNNGAGVFVTVKNAAGTYTALSTNVNATTPATFASGDIIEMSGSTPILGWSSSVQMSDQTDTRVISARAYLGTNQTGINTNNTYVKINVDTRDYDTHSAFDTTNKRYSILVPGYYDISASITLASTNILNSQYLAAIYKNGVLYQIGQLTVPAAASSVYLNVSTKAAASIGDYFELYIYGSGNNSSSTLTASSGASSTVFSINRISGPSAIAATETIAASMSFLGAPTGTLGASYNTVVFGTKDLDTHGWYNTSTGEYTSGVSGLFEISASLGIQATLTAGQYVMVRVGNLTTGKFFYGNFKAVASATSDYNASATGIVRVTAGDKLVIQSYSTGSALSYSAATAGSSFSIKRVGN